MAAQQNQINLGKLYFIARNGELPPFLYYSKVYFEIVAQSADGTAILSFGMYVDVVMKWVLLDFLHLLTMYRSPQTNTGLGGKE